MKIHTIHNGCEVNLADSENAKNSMLSSHAISFSSKDDADTIIFHVCTFTQNKEDETKHMIENLLENTNKQIIVSGCFLKEYVIDERVQYIKNERLGIVIESIKQKEQEKKTREAEKKIPHSLSPFVTISRGCYGSCTFCSIKSVKGSNLSKSVEDILVDIEQRLHLEYIKLVGDEVAGYGRDIGLNLKILVDKIIEKYPAIKLKFGSLNCKILKKFSTEELAIFAYENITGNIHIPIQSASNKVLQKMSRGYTIEEYFSIYKTLKNLGVKKISGDLICGFPYEDEQDHEKNIRFITENQFDFMEVFAYHEREGTKAAGFEQLNFELREKRAIELIVNYIKSYSKWHDIPLELLVTQQRVFNTNIKFN